jgi:hypothetical protein
VIEEREGLGFALALPVEGRRGSDAAKVAAAQNQPGDFDPEPAETSVVHG